MNKAFALIIPLLGAYTLLVYRANALKYTGSAAFGVGPIAFDLASNHKQGNCHTTERIVFALCVGECNCPEMAQTTPPAPNDAGVSVFVLRRRDVALRRRDVALHRRDVALHRRDVALQRRDVAMRRRDVAMQRLYEWADNPPQEGKQKAPTKRRGLFCC